VRLLKIKLSCFVFSNLNPTLRKIKRLSISKTKQVILYRDVIYVYSEIRVELKNFECWENVEAIDLEVRCTIHMVNFYLRTVLSLFFALRYDL